MNTSRDNVWLSILARFGRALFLLAIIGMGVETFICVYTHTLVAHDTVVPVIPWVPAIPFLPDLAGAILIFGGFGLLFRRTLLISSIALGVLMVFCGIAFDGRHPNLMSPEWRTDVLEPIVIGCLAWLLPKMGAVPSWLHRLSRYLIACSLIIFGVGHFQVIVFIAKMVPAWIPWHTFWAVFFGVAFIAAGVSFATGFLQRWAALCLGLMFAIWTLTIHLWPVVNYFRMPGAPQDPDKWSDVFIVVALWGGFWAITRNLAAQADARVIR